LKPFGAHLVLGCDLVLIMDGAIQFDRDTRSSNPKVKDIWTNSMLAADAVRECTPIPYRFPNAFLRGGLPLSKPTSRLDNPARGSSNSLLSQTTSLSELPGYSGSSSPLPEWERGGAQRRGEGLRSRHHPYSRR
jgi:hypothetical protein